MPLHSSVRTTHEWCFGSGTAAKFRGRTRLGTAPKRLPFSLFSAPVTIKLSKMCQAGQAACAKRK